MRWSGMVKWMLLVLVMVGAAIPAAAEAALSFKTVGTYPATIHGSASKGGELITTEAGKVECATAYHAELTAASTTLALAPTYTGCVAFGFLEATVNPEGCKYVLHVTEQSAEDKYKATFDVSCEAGKSIKVAAGTCKIEIKSQSGLGSVALTNDTAATPQRDITFDPEVSGLAYTVTQDGFLCPFGGTGNKTGATFTANPATTLTGQSPSNPETKIGIEVG